MLDGIAVQVLVCRRRSLSLPYQFTDTITRANCSDHLPTRHYLLCCLFGFALALL